MIVVFNSDERFASVFATSVLSLFDNNQEVDEITVYLIEDNITKESKAKFQEIAQTYRRHIITIPMPDLEKLVGVDVVIPSYNRMATCGRLFIPSLLPKDIDKVIYADCDTMFESSIEDLWNIDISKYSVGMTDCAQNPSFRTQLGLSKKGIYYNSGLLLINLKRWREEQAEERFLDFIKSQGGYIPFPDEGVLNAVFDGDILLLPLRYNAMTQIFAFSYKQIFCARGIKHYYSQEEVEEAKRHPVMIHFNSNFYISVRPWVKGCTHPFAKRYLEYRNMTPWKEEPLWENPNTRLQRLYTRFCYAIPKPIAIWTARLITLYITPLKHRYRKFKCIREMRRQFNGGGYVRELTDLLAYFFRLPYAQAACAAEGMVA